MVDCGQAPVPPGDTVHIAGTENSTEVQFQTYIRTLSTGIIAPSALPAFNPEALCLRPTLPTRRILMRVDDPGVPEPGSLHA